MTVDMAKVNRLIAHVAHLEATIDAAQNELADTQRLQAANELRHKQDLEIMYELMSKQEAANEAVKVIAEKAIAQARALERFIEAKGLRDEFRATVANEILRS
jgi:hypothetical protein